MRIVGFLLGLFLLTVVTSSTSSSAQTSSGPAPAASQATTPEPPAAKETALNKDDKKNNDDRGRKLHLRLGMISLGAGYSHFSGPGYYPYAIYPYYPLGWETSALWTPYWGPYSFFAPEYFAYGSAKGEVRLAADPKTASVYLDRAYAGTADHLKSIWLEPGAYDLSVTAAGRAAYNQRIYVLSGKSLKIDARLAAAAETPGETTKDKQ